MATSIYIDEQGSGPDLVLLHGWAMHGGIWEPVVKPFTEAGFKVHVVDLPGHGRSEPLHTYNIETVAKVLLDVVPAGATWVGWSLGGLIAMEAARFSDKVGKLLLVGTSARFIRDQDWPHGMEHVLLKGFAHDLSNNWTRTLKRFLSLQLGSDTNLAILRKIRGRFFEVDPPHGQALSQGLDLLEQVDLRPVLSQLDIPTLILHGFHDRLVPVSAGQYLADHLPQAQLQVHERAGHIPFLSHQDWFLEQAIPFLKQESLDAAG